MVHKCSARFIIFNLLSRKRYPKLANVEVNDSTLKSKACPKDGDTNSAL